MQTTVQTTFSNSFRVQTRVVGALLMREVITRYGRHNFGFIWLFLVPMIYTAAVTGLWNLFHKGHHVADLPMTALAMTGYSTVMLWRNGATHCARAVEPNLGLLHHQNVRVIDLFLARIMLEVSGGTISMIALYIFFYCVGWMDPPADIMKMLEAWVLLMWLTFGLGLFVGAMSERFEFFERVWHPFVYFYFPVSGAHYLVVWLPKRFAEVALYLPTVHVCELLRHGYFGDTIKTFEDIGYLTVFNIVLTLVGLLLARQTASRVELQ